MSVRHVLLWLVWLSSRLFSSYLTCLWAGFWLFCLHLGALVTGSYDITDRSKELASVCELVGGGWD